MRRKLCVVVVCGLLVLGLGVSVPATEETPKEAPKKAEDKKCGGYLEKCDTNKNSRIACSEARKCGLKTPIKKDHPAYKCMRDGDGDGQVCE